MQALRNAAFLARLVLAWFALSIGVAVASPLVKPQGIELICSGGSMKLLAKSGEDSAPAAGHTLDCPLCASLDAPPLATQRMLQAPRPVALVLQPVGASRHAITAAPPPARGPPLFLL